MFDSGILVLFKHSRTARFQAVLLGVYCTVSRIKCGVEFFFAKELPLRLLRGTCAFVRYSPVRLPRTSSGILSHFLTHAFTRPGAIATHTHTNNKQVVLQLCRATKSDT